MGWFFRLCMTGMCLGMSIIPALSNNLEAPSICLVYVGEADKAFPTICFRPGADLKPQKPSIITFDSSAPKVQGYLNFVLSNLSVPTACLVQNANWQYRVVGTQVSLCPKQMKMLINEISNSSHHTKIRALEKRLEF